MISATWVANEQRAPQSSEELASAVGRAAARGEVPAAIQVGRGGGTADDAEPESPDRLDPPPMIPVSQSSPSSTIDSYTRSIGYLFRYC